MRNDERMRHNGLNVYMTSNLGAVSSRRLMRFRRQLRRRRQQRRHLLDLNHTSTSIRINSRLKYKYWKIEENTHFKLWCKNACAYELTHFSENPVPGKQLRDAHLKFSRFPDRVVKYREIDSITRVQHCWISSSKPNCTVEPVQFSWISTAYGVVK